MTKTINVDFSMATGKSHNITNSDENTHYFVGVMYVMSSQHDRSFYGSVEVGLHSVDNSWSTTAIRLYDNQN